MPRTTDSEETVLLRIKRFGKEWATCGIGITPPPGTAHDPRMKRLCPKLVPGQVIELPVSHPLVKKRCKLVEEVDGPEKDEFIRPWTFHSAEEAAIANPSKSRLGPEQILNGLTLRDGAINNAPVRREKARKAATKDFEQGSPRDPDYDDDLPEPEYEDVRLPDPAELKVRSQNRAVRAEPEPVEDDPAPRSRPRSRRRA
jgi:hypothetical protein